jgi:hypothetical protein
VGEDVNKIRQAIEQDNTHRLEAIEERLTTLAKDLDQSSREERTELRNAVHQMRKRMASMDQEIAVLKEELSRRAALGQKRREEPPRDPSDKDPAHEQGKENPAVGALDAPAAVASRAPIASPQSRSAEAPSKASTSEAFNPGTDARNTVVRTAGGVQRMELQDFAPHKG